MLGHVKQEILHHEWQGYCCFNGYYQIRANGLFSSPLTDLRQFDAHWYWTAQDLRANFLVLQSRYRISTGGIKRVMAHSPRPNSQSRIDPNRVE